jgi:signal transduction histidine kinase
MTTLVGQQPSPVTFRMWTVLAAPGVQIAIAVAGFAAAVGGGLLVATSDHLVDPVEYGLQLAIVIGGTVAAALVWLRRRPASRVAPLLLAFALVTAGITLEGSTDGLLRSIGIVLEPVFFVLAYVLVFAFPDGRLTGRAERLLLAGYGVYFLLDFVPWLLFSPVLNGGAPLGGCNAACPENALMIADRPEVAAWSGTNLAWVVIALTSATLVLLVVRLEAASRPRRRTLLPVYVPALLVTVPVLGFHGFAAGVLHLDADALSKAGWSVTIGRLLLPFGFLLAIVLANYFAGASLKRLIGRIGDSPGPAGLRELVADALDDPSVELVFRVDGGAGFVDSRGEPVASATARDGRASSPVARQGDTVAVIWHDPALSTDPELVRAVSQATLLALESRRLQGELIASRARAVAAGDAERRRVERDLHDGAQQHLVALRIKAELARERATEDPEIAARLADLGEGLDDVLSELRDLAHGIYPPPLRDYGLQAALASAARRCTPPAVLVADGLGRYPVDVETAVYFCCLEGLQNVGKHAGAGAHAEVRLVAQDDQLGFEVIDDGAGCDVESARRSGTGFANMTERVAALGGSLTIDSASGHGTRVRGRIPLGRP